jgi:hypothetical protein
MAHLHVDRMSRSLEGIELAMVLEEALLSGDKHVAALKPYLLDEPVEALCIRGGFETEIVIYARHGHTAFFVATDSAQFGMGTTNEFGDVIDAYHYPNLTMALRAFIGAATRESR